MSGGFKSIDSWLNCLTTPKMEIVSQDRTIDNKQNNNHLPERKKFGKIHLIILCVPSFIS